MSSLNQTLIAAGAQNSILYGCCEWSQAYGTVISAKIDRMSDQQEFKDCRNNQKAILLANKRYEAEMTIEVDPGVTLPEIGASLAFPDVGVTGQVLKIGRQWEQGGLKKATITATHWDNLGDAPTVTELSS